MNEERRTQKRYIIEGLRAQVRKKTLFGLSTKPTEQKYPSLDISEGGMQCAINKDSFKVGDEVLLDITIPSTRSKPLCLRARVVWVKMSSDPNFGLAGMQFISPEPEQQTELKTLIQKFGSDKQKVTPYLRSKMEKEDSLLPRFKRQ